MQAACSAALGHSVNTANYSSTMWSSAVELRSLTEESHSASHLLSVSAGGGDFLMGSKVTQPSSLAAGLYKATEEFCQVAIANALNTVAKDSELFIRWLVDTVDCTHDNMTTLSLPLGS